MNKSVILTFVLSSLVLAFFSLPTLVVGGSPKLPFLKGTNSELCVYMRSYQNEFREECNRIGEFSFEPDDEGFVAFLQMNPTQRDRLKYLRILKTGEIFSVFAKRAAAYKSICDSLDTCAGDHPLFVLLDSCDEVIEVTLHNYHRTGPFVLLNETAGITATGVLCVTPNLISLVFETNFQSTPLDRSDEPADIVQVFDFPYKTP